MQPEHVRPGNFAVSQIIYNQGGFSISVGIWTDDGTRRLAMRWNDSPTDLGYPNVFSHPMWFQLPEDINAIITTLVENENP